MITLLVSNEVVNNYIFVSSNVSNIVAHKLLVSI